MLLLCQLHALDFTQDYIGISAAAVSHAALETL